MSLLKNHVKKQQGLVQDWNGKFLIGQQVEVKLDSGALFQTKTTSMAWLMGGHSAVIKVDGISGGFALDRVKVVQFCSHPGCGYPDGKVWKLPVEVFEVIGHFFSPFQRGLLPTAPLWQRWHSRLKNWFCVALLCRCQLCRQVGPKTVRRGSQGLRRHLVAVKLTIGKKIMKPMGGVLGSTTGDPAVRGFFSERAMSCFNKFSQRVIGFHTLVSFFRQLHCRLDALIYTTTACRMQYLFQTIF